MLFHSTQTIHSCKSALHRIASETASRNCFYLPNGNGNGKQPAAAAHVVIKLKLFPYTHTCSCTLFYVPIVFAAAAFFSFLRTHDCDKHSVQSVSVLFSFCNALLECNKWQREFIARTFKCQRIYAQTETYQQIYFKYVSTRFLLFVHSDHKPSTKLL